MNTTNGLHFFLLLTSLSGSPVEHLQYFSLAYQARNEYDRSTISTQTSNIGQNTKVTIEKFYHKTVSFGTRTYNRYIQ